jgi:hypothetical protein
MRSMPFEQLYEKYFSFWDKLSDSDKEFLCRNSSIEHFVLFSICLIVSFDN